MTPIPFPKPRGVCLNLGKRVSACSLGAVFPYTSSLGTDSVFTLKTAVPYGRVSLSVRLCVTEWLGVNETAPQSHLLLPNAHHMPVCHLKATCCCFKKLYKSPFKQTKQNKTKAVELHEG